MIYLFIIGRALFGGYFLMNAYNHFANYKLLADYAKSKNVPMAKASVLSTGVMLLLGGAFIIAGVYIDVAVFLLAIFLLGTTFQMHKFWNATDVAVRMSEEINFYKNLALLGAVLMLLAIQNWTVIGGF